MKVSVLGLGKLGCCFAAALAAQGLEVVGVDLKASVVDAVNRGAAPHDEPGLGVLLADAGERLAATTDAHYAVTHTDATFVIVPTPSDPAGFFRLDHVLRAMQQVGAALAEKRGYHLVVQMSTVLPGDIRRAVLPALEAASGKSAGNGFGFCYLPEFVALGTVIRDFLDPDMVVIGEHDGRAGDALEELVRSVCENNPAVHRMSIVDAELAKIALNFALTQRIAYANWLAEMCERLPGADVDRVTGAIGADGRIGPKFLRAGGRAGGPCFPRDIRAMGYLARALGVDGALPRAVADNNEAQIDRVMAAVDRAGGRVGILGLAYKAGTPVTEESQALEVAWLLGEEDAPVLAYDPKARPDLAGVEYRDSAQAVVDEADTVIVALPYAEFASVQYRAGQTVIDLWRIVDRKRLPAGVAHVAFGRG